jgi:hypothetical protein
MKVVICAGIHDLHLTQALITAFESSFTPLSQLKETGNLLVYSPPYPYLSLSAVGILQFLHDRLGSPKSAPPLIFLGFSAGVVGALGAAWGWQLMGGNVRAAIAVDGWGVPLFTNFPCYRLSHDYFTHWSSALLGESNDSFYADPPVEHLVLWRSLPTITGWWVHSDESHAQHRTYLTAAEFLSMLLKRHENEGVASG